MAVEEPPRKSLDLEPEVQVNCIFHVYLVLESFDKLAAQDMLVKATPCMIPEDMVSELFKLSRFGGNGVPDQINNVANGQD